MESFGRFLRAEREARGVSIEDLATVTKIGRQVLIDLEADHFESLPPPVFLKGFVRTIARTLALPQKEVVERFDEFMATHGPGAGLPGDDETTGGESGPTPAPRESWGPMPFVLGVVALLVAIVIAYQVGSEDEPGKVAQYANQPEPTQPAKADAPAEPAAKAQSEPESEPEPAAPVAPEPAESAARAEPAEEQVSPAPRNQWIVLQARKEIWVRASEDGEDPRNFKLEAGESIRQRFAESLEIRVGDPSRLSVITPAGEFKTLGGASKPRTWNFPLSEQARAELAELSANFVEPAPDPEPEPEPNIEEPAAAEEPPAGEAAPAPEESAPNDEAAE